MKADLMTTTREDFDKKMNNDLPFFLLLTYVVIEVNK